MNVSAVPNYVNAVAAGFADCPPGHRFNLYFPIWREGDWQVDKQGKAAALRQSLKLGYAAAPLAALCKRQQTLADGLPDECRFIMEARSTAPFATGLGLEHPIENGFAFLSPYGLPYLAGSGVKGVLRRSAEELRDNDELSQPVIDVLFGHEKDDNARRGALTCWDVFAVPPKDGSHKDSLVVEIMTPHFGEYYQNGGTPHDAGKPNPIPFLAVPAGSQFCFIITCEPMLLTDAIQKSEWKALVGRIIEYAFDWLGFGAKTAVGYGAMTTKMEAPGKAAATSPPLQAQETVWDAATLSLDPGTGEIKASFQGKSTAGLRGKEADALREVLGDRAARLKRDKQLKNVAVRVRVEGNMTQLLGLAVPEA